MHRKEIGGKTLTTISKSVNRFDIIKEFFNNFDRCCNLNDIVYEIKQISNSFWHLNLKN